MRVKLEVMRRKLSGVTEKETKIYPKFLLRKDTLTMTYYVRISVFSIQMPPSAQLILNLYCSHVNLGIESLLSIISSR